VGPSVRTQYARISGMNKNRRVSPTKPAHENNAGGVLPNQLAGISHNKWKKAVASWHNSFV